MFLLSMFDIWRRLFMLREVQKLFPLLIQTSERPFSVVDFKQIIENLENFPFRHFKQFFIRGCIFVFSKKIPIENVGSGKEGSQTNVKRNNVRNEPTSYHFLNGRRKNSFETISLPFCLLLLPFQNVVSTGMLAKHHAMLRRELYESANSMMCNWFIYLILREILHFNLIRFGYLLQNISIKPNCSNRCARQCLNHTANVARRRCLHQYSRQVGLSAQL